MAKRSGDTRQVNLALTESQEEIVRILVQRMRAGGLGYETRLRLFIQDPPEPRYMDVNDLDRRFGALERRLEHLEHAFGLADRPAEEAAPKPSGRKSR